VLRYRTQIISFGIASSGHASKTPSLQNGGYLKSPSKNASGQGFCGGDMSLPNGTCETRNIKSGSEKRIDAGHVGDISSGAAKTPL
jgi:hypothetical protein